MVALVEPKQRDIGPDPRLNGQGVALTGRQRLILTGVAVAIGAVLVLLLLGVPTGSTGPAAPVAPVAGSGPYRVVLDGSGSATVVVAQDGTSEQPVRVDLPYTVPIDRGTGVVSVQARLSGRDQGAGLTCTITDAAGTVVRQVSGSGARALIRCGSVLP